MDLYDRGLYLFFIFVTIVDGYTLLGIPLYKIGEGLYTFGEGGGYTKTGRGCYVYFILSLPLSNLSAYSLSSISANSFLAFLFEIPAFSANTDAHVSIVPL